MDTETETIITQLQHQARSYPAKSPQREAYIAAIIRYEYADEDARIDAVIMRSWEAERRLRSNVPM